MIEPVDHGDADIEVSAGGVNLGGNRVKLSGDSPYADMRFG